MDADINIQFKGIHKMNSIRWNIQGQTFSHPVSKDNATIMAREVCKIAGIKEKVRSRRR